MVSVVLKKLDNMKKVLASGCTMIMTVVLSHFFFGREPHLNFYLAMAIIINSIVLYNLPAAKAAAGPVITADVISTASSLLPSPAPEHLLQSSTSARREGVLDQDDRELLLTTGTSFL